MQRAPCWRRRQQGAKRARRLAKRARRLAKRARRRPFHPRDARPRHDARREDHGAAKRARLLPQARMAA
eukprot:scaffold66587_cov36-Phaeocystis_antarctica.AAC.1